jgi:hypothetical protein
MKRIVLTLFTFAAIAGCTGRNDISEVSSPIAAGQMPSITKDKRNNIHLAYGTGDSLMYCTSPDQGTTFSAPRPIGVLPDLAASHTRGPQLRATASGLLVTACTDAGNIYSYLTDSSGKWVRGARVNDQDTAAKENLMALGTDGQNAFAVWLDLRDGKNKIFGSRSSDGGRSWGRNGMIYASPDSTVCECCKPSVVMRGNTVTVMFRNWLDGNRDLYLIQSNDGGSSFGRARKLGKDSWAMNGCPMDGGGLALDAQGNAKAVWNRKGVIYASDWEKAEKKVGEGRSCTIALAGTGSFYAWTANGNVVVTNGAGRTRSLGAGLQPSIVAVDEGRAVCVWERDKKIYRSVVDFSN